MRILSTLALITATTFLFAACSSTKLNDKPPVVDRSGAGTTQSPTADARTVNPIDAGSTDPLNDPKGVLAQRSVYFDYDRYVVRDDAKPIIENHAKYLNAHKARRIIIQGNTDDRGGREYNLALGQKRAEAVRKSLSLLGVPESQMEAVSLGKEKPKAVGNDEAAYSENRRADIVY